MFRAHNIQFRVAVDPVVSVVLSLCRRFRRVWDLAVAFDNAQRRRHPTGRAQREDGRGGYARVLVRVDTGLSDSPGTRFVCLQIPVRFVERLPDTVEVWMAVWHPA